MTGVIQRLKTAGMSAPCREDSTTNARGTPSTQSPGMNSHACSNLSIASVIQRCAFRACLARCDDVRQSQCLRHMAWGPAGTGGLDACRRAGLTGLEPQEGHQLQRGPGASGAGALACACCLKTSLLNAERRACAGPQHHPGLRHRAVGQDTHLRRARR